jgi:hypothetical protein
MKGNLTMIWARVYASVGNGARPDKAMLPSCSQGGYPIVYIAANDHLACAACASNRQLGQDIIDVESSVVFDADDPPICAFCSEPINGR